MANTSPKVAATCRSRPQKRPSTPLTTIAVTIVTSTQFMRSLPRFVFGFGAGDARHHVGRDGGDRAGGPGLEPEVTGPVVGGRQAQVPDGQDTGAAQRRAGRVGADPDGGRAVPAEAQR